MINSFIIILVLIFRFLNKNWGSWINTHINRYLLFFSFRKSSIVVPINIYKVLTKFFITVEVKVAVIEMKKQFFLVTHYGKFPVGFHHFDVKAFIGRYHSWYTIYSNIWIGILAILITDFAILPGDNSELSSFVPTWRIK